MAAAPRANSDEIRRAIRVLYDPGEVIELRIPKSRREGTLSGYFNDHDLLAQAIGDLDGRGPAVYLTLNPVNPALLARSANHVKQWAEFTTADSDISFRRWMLIDCDPKRPSHISSNDTEHKLALEYSAQ